MSYAGARGAVLRLGDLTTSGARPLPSRPPRSLIVTPQHEPGDIAHWARLEEVDAAWAAQPTFATKCRAALAEVLAFVEAGPCYAGVSWGKDSTVLAHLVARASAERGVRIPLVWVRYEPISNPECPAVRDRFLERYESVVDYHEPTVWWSGRGGAAEGRTIDRGAGSAWDAAVAPFGSRYLSGVRAEESGDRARRMLGGLATRNTCAPIGRWTSEDVFAYLWLHELPVHPAYAYSGGGVYDRKRLRVATLAVERDARGAGRGRLEWEQRYYGARLAEVRRLLSA